jgi:hypothetical protein
VALPGREAELALIAQAMDDPAVAGMVVAGEEALGQAGPERYVAKRAVATSATN